MSKISEIIRGKDLTQLEAAEILGLPPPKLSGILRGRFRGVFPAQADRLPDFTCSSTNSNRLDVKGQVSALVGHFFDVDVTKSQR
jgi:hypothetical protein